MSHKQTGLLIATLFLARDLAHREHLKVSGAGSYARHMALGSFYEGIVDVADRLTETYQGVFDVLLDIPLAAHNTDMDIIDALAAQLDWIHSTRYDCIPREWTCLHNIVDEAEALYATTLYKLRRLQ